MLHADFSAAVMMTTPWHAVARKFEIETEGTHSYFGLASNHASPTLHSLPPSSLQRAGQPECDVWEGDQCKRHGQHRKAIGHRAQHDLV